MGEETLFGGAAAVCGGIMIAESSTRSSPSQSPKAVVTCQRTQVKCGMAVHGLIARSSQILFSLELKKKFH